MRDTGRGREAVSPGGRIRGPRSLERGPRDKKPAPLCVLTRVLHGEYGQDAPRVSPLFPRDGGANH